MVTPAKDVNKVTAMEIDRLDDFTEAASTSTPKLLDFQRFLQGQDLWMPDGYMVCILMERLPGISLENFWQLPREERDQIRKAFQFALE
jgi:hypothetical protein